jgi:hypothetical protein
VSGSTIQAIINPLAFLEVDEPWAGIRNESVTAEHILKFLCTPGSSSAVVDLVQRYKKVSIETPRLFAAPAEARLLERLIWPLRQAKGSYLLGNFLGMISLCGMVGEMAAILIFDLADVRLNNAPLDAEKQKALFGSSFEKLGQERRVELLRAYGMIDEPLRQAFDTIRTRRRRYLHLWSADHASLEDDAVECFKAAVVVVVSALGLSVDEGKLILRQEIYDYLAKHNAGPEPVETE